MCVQPVPLPNLSYKDKKGLSFLKDTSFSKILVPCGHCPECIKQRQQGYIQRAYMEALHHHVFFCMFSYNKNLPSVSATDGKLFKYADWHDLQNMFKHLRQKNALGRPFRYFAVSEFGGKKHRPHFHVLLYVPKYPSDGRFAGITLQRSYFLTLLRYWRRNIGSDRYPEYVPLCDYHESRCLSVPSGFRRNFDVQWIPDSSSSVAVVMYAQKYMLKESDYEKRLYSALRLNYSEWLVDKKDGFPICRVEDELLDLPEDFVTFGDIMIPSYKAPVCLEWQYLWNTVRCRSARSLGFGLAPIGFEKRSPIPNPSVIDRLRLGVQLSKVTGSQYAKFFLPSDGRSMSLSRYYKSRGDIYTLDDKLTFLLNRDPDAVDGSFLPDEFDLSQHNRKNEKYAKQKKQLSESGDVLDSF